MRYHSIQFIALLLITSLIASCGASNDAQLPTLVPIANEFSGPPGTQFVSAPWERVQNGASGLAIEYPQGWNGRVLETGLRLIPNIASSATGDFRIAGSASLAPVEQASELLTAVIDSQIATLSAGNPENIEQIEPITTGIINGYETASAFVQVTLQLPDDISESELSEVREEFESESGSLRVLVVALRNDGQTAVFIGTTSVTLSDTYRPIFNDMIQTIQLSSP